MSSNLLTLFNDTKSHQKYHKYFGKFSLKFADSMEELSEVFRLRFEVFFNHDQSSSNEDRWDVDMFDLAADHLIIIDNEKSKIVGTYRLTRSTEANIFYTQTEFDLSEILKLEGTKVECGRACIHKDYRDGQTIGLLWQGLGDYIINNNIRWMFGCSSIHLESGFKRNLVHTYLMQNSLCEAKLVSLPENPPDIEILDDIDSKSERLAHRLLPPLLRTYLNLGAKVCGLPHYDEEMHCIDYLTLLDTQTISKDFYKKFCES